MVSSGTVVFGFETVVPKMLVANRGIAGGRISRTQISEADFVRKFLTYSVEWVAPL